MKSTNSRSACKNDHNYISNRLFYIDTLKGFTILCVILGHIIQYSYNNFDENHLFRYIYAFHMPLFMMISGFVSSTKPSPVITFTIKKGKHLLLPFIVWGIFSSILHQKFDIYHIINLFIYPDTGLWFLWVLFFISIFHNLSLIISQKYNINKYKCFIFILFFLFIISKLSHGLGGSHFISWYFIFYICGVILRGIKKLPSNTKILSLFLFIFLILGFYWKRIEAPIFISTNIVLTALCIYCYKIITALTACIFLFSFHKSIESPKSKVQNFLQLLGKETLGIYAIHYYFISIWEQLEFKPLMIYMTLEFIFISIFSLLSVKMLKLNKYLSFILLGNPLKQKTNEMA